MAYATHLGVRLLVVYVLLLVIPIVIIASYSYLFLEGNLQKHLIADMQHLTTIHAHTVNMTLERIHDDIRYLERHINNALSMRGANAYVELDSFAHTHNLYRHIALLTPDAGVVAGTLPPEFSAWLATQEFASIADLTPGTIRFVTIHDANTTELGQTVNEALLVVIVRSAVGNLLIDIDTNYFMRGVVGYQEDEFYQQDELWHSGQWTLLMQNNVMLTPDQTVQLGQMTRQNFGDNDGYFVLPNQHLTVFYHRTGPANNWILLHTLSNDGLIPDMYNYLITVVLLVVGGVVSVMGLALLAIMHLTEPIRHLERMVEALRGNQPVSLPPIRYAASEFETLMTTFVDMAQELEIRQRNERALIEQLIHAQEEERKRIAYDLHDGMLQDLVGARFYIGEAREVCDGICHHTEDNPVMQSYTILTHAIAEGRRIMQGLHPTVLEDLGLEAAIMELCEQSAEKGGWRKQCKIIQLSHQPDLAICVTLYRIAQEALSNICRHAHASNVILSLCQEDANLRLTIIDDGQGFDLSKMAVNGGNHWGIRTMQERAQMMNGTCLIQTSTGQGTRIEVNIPFLECQEEYL